MNKKSYIIPAHYSQITGMQKSQISREKEKFEFREIDGEKFIVVSLKQIDEERKRRLKNAIKAEVVVDTEDVSNLRGILEEFKNLTPGYEEKFVEMLEKFSEKNNNFYKTFNEILRELKEAIEEKNYDNSIITKAYEKIEKIMTKQDQVNAIIITQIKKMDSEIERLSLEYNNGEKSIRQIRGLIEEMENQANETEKSLRRYLFLFGEIYEKLQKAKYGSISDYIKKTLLPVFIAFLLCFSGFFYILQNDKIKKTQTRQQEETKQKKTSKKNREQSK
jgi:hypothetical protein